MLRMTTQYRAKLLFFLTGRYREEELHRGAVSTEILTTNTKVHQGIFNS